MRSIAAIVAANCWQKPALVSVRNSRIELDPDRRDVST